MKTTITKPMAARIQALIDAPEPMTHERLQMLMLDPEELPREGRIAGIAHVFKIAEAGLVMADAIPIREGIGDKVACSWCWASTDKAQGVAWHEDECIWRHLVETVKGTPSV